MTEMVDRVGGGGRREFMGVVQKVEVQFILFKVNSTLNVCVYSCDDSNEGDGGDGVMMRWAFRKRKDSSVLLFFSSR